MQFFIAPPGLRRYRPENYPLPTMRSFITAALLACLSGPSFGAIAEAAMLATLDASYDSCEPRLPQLKGYRDNMYIGLLSEGRPLPQDQSSKVLSSLQLLRSTPDYKNLYQAKIGELAKQSERDLSETCQRMADLYRQSNQGKTSSSVSDLVQGLFGKAITLDMLVKWDAGHALCLLKQPAFRKAYEGTGYLDRVLMGYSARPRNPQFHPNEYAEGLVQLKAIRTDPSYLSKYGDEQAALMEISTQETQQMCRTFEGWFKPFKGKG